MNLQNPRHCIGINAIPPHDLEWTPENFAPWAMDPNRKNVRCRDCDREYRRSRRAAKAGSPTTEVKAASASLASVSFADAEDGKIPEDQVANSHEYVPDGELVLLWESIVRGTIDHGDPAANIIFFGPSGSGKTEGARYLAARVGLPFTKVDAASMTDPESWFGTREIISEGGISVTKYIPSAFVEAVQKPGVSFIDEVTRVDDEHRNVLLPLTDGTGQVTNPLTGEVVVRHPHHFIIMAGNRGLQFTGTSAVDPAFTTRALTVEFDYMPEAAERKVAMDATGCDALTAQVFVRFATESRAKAKADPDFPPISTREVIAACRRAARGLNRDLAAKFAILNQASAEGGGSSVRSELETIWNGVRVTREELDEEAEDPAVKGWVCPKHNRMRVVPAGTSKTGRPYSAFKACPEPYCDETEGRAGQNAQRVVPSNATQGLVCPSCNTQNQPGRVTFCASCGAKLT